MHPVLGIARQVLEITLKWGERLAEIEELLENSSSDCDPFAAIVKIREIVRRDAEQANVVALVEELGRLMKLEAGQRGGVA